MPCVGWWAMHPQWRAPEPWRRRPEDAETRSSGGCAQVASPRTPCLARRCAPAAAVAIDRGPPPPLASPDVKKRSLRAVGVPACTGECVRRASQGDRATQQPAGGPLRGARHQHGLVAQSKAYTSRLHHNQGRREADRGSTPSEPSKRLSRDRVHGRRKQRCKERRPHAPRRGGRCGKLCEVLEDGHSIGAISCQFIRTMPCIVPDCVCPGRKLAHSGHPKVGVRRWPDEHTEVRRRFEDEERGCSRNVEEDPPDRVRRLAREVDHREEDLEEAKETGTKSDSALNQRCREAVREESERVVR